MIKERIVQILENKGIAKEEFYAKIGMTSANFRGKAKTTPLNSVAIENILSELPDVNPTWLLTGKGKMFNEEIASPAFSDQPRGVPFYDVDFCGGFDMMVNDQTLVPSGYIDFPQYNKADSWARITGHSMEPLISNGDIIALRKVEDWQSYLLYGEIYGIMTNEYRTVKRIRKAQDPDKVLLEPINKDFDPIELEKRLITGVWAVLGCAKKFF